MQKKYVQTIFGILIISLLIISSTNAYANIIPKKEENISQSSTNTINLDFSFSTPILQQHDNYTIVQITETNYNKMILFNMDPGKPVLPVNISVFNLPFGATIEDIEIIQTLPEIIDLPSPIGSSKAYIDAEIGQSIPIEMNKKIYSSSNPYPENWVDHRTAGGLNQNEHVTFLILRVNPVRYLPSLDKIEFCSNFQITITYNTPEEQIIDENSDYDLLILCPKEFQKSLQPLVCHKNQMGVKTKMVNLGKVYEEMYWQGRDHAEKIKYFIKTAIENWGIKNVLLVGGIKGQTLKWNMPVRYSHVVPPEEQEYAEHSYLSDLYFADIYNGDASFSSWDSNHDNIFSGWNETDKDEMDLYPDVNFGRLPCRSLFELKIMVDKIINYEKTPACPDWFNNLLLVAGDSYNDVNGFNEGEEISEKAITLMPDFTPIKVYADAASMDISRKTVNAAMKQGAGFAYFCGHGSPVSWSTHFPPAIDDGDNWTTGYKIKDMLFLKNGHKLPITVVGGCHNGQFDTSMGYMLKGIAEEGIFKYFRLKGENRGGFYSRYGEWAPNCWAWMLTSNMNGGAIACIANSGLGTHGDDDVDNNTIPDYLEVLDGWLELRFLELYGTYGQDNLGVNYVQTLTEYMHRFLGDDAIMDTKMVQQWQLFGDPSLKIGGYHECDSC